METSNTQPAGLPGPAHQARVSELDTHLQVQPRLVIRRALSWKPLESLQELSWKSRAFQGSVFPGQTTGVVARLTPMPRPLEEGFLFFWFGFVLLSWSLRASLWGCLLAMNSCCALCLGTVSGFCLALVNEITGGSLARGFMGGI